MIVPDEELTQAVVDLGLYQSRLCGRPNCEVCISIRSEYGLPPYEDILKDLIEARERIKVLESNQCAC